MDNKSSKKDSVIVVIKPKESLIQSIGKDLITFMFLSFCIYISQDSTWWTFISGGLFLIVLSLKIASITGEITNKFNNKEDAIKYLNNQ